MRVISIVNKRSKQYDKIREELLDDRLNVVRALVFELIEYRKENEYSYKKQVFKLCRKKLIKRKVKTYNIIEKFANLVYMYILRRFGYYLKNVINKNMDMPEGFYQGPAYLWEYSQELNGGGIGERT